MDAVSLIVVVVTLWVAGSTLRGSLAWGPPQAEAVDVNSIPD